MPPCAASSSASASALSAVSATAPSAARPRRSTASRRELSLSAMWPRAPTLPTSLALRADERSGPVALGDRRELRDRSRLGGGGDLRVLQHGRGPVAVYLELPDAARVFRL